MILAWCNAQSKRSIKPFVGRRPSAGRRPKGLAVTVDRDGPGETMKTRVKWVEGASFVGETGSGHAVVIDGAPEYGGRNLGPRPMEMVLTGTAACTAFDVVLILRRARQPIADCVVEAEAERAATDPKVFTRIHFRYQVAGRGLAPHQVERAVKLSKEKYCSATLMLAKTAEITYEVAIVEGDAIPLPATPPD
jgi:putative redox protein